jgi:DNA mismatch repair protein MutS
MTQLADTVKENKPVIQTHEKQKIEQGQLSLFEEEKLEADLRQKERQNDQPSELEQRIKELDLLNMTPMDAMNVLYECQKALKQTDRKNVLIRG